MQLYSTDELVIIELVQLSEYADGAVRLASFSTNARDFLFPYPCLAPTYSSTDRELLLSRTVAFPVSEMSMWCVCMNTIQYNTIHFIQFHLKMCFTLGISEIKELKETIVLFF